MGYTLNRNHRSRTRRANDNQKLEITEVYRVLLQTVQIQIQTAHNVKSCDSKSSGAWGGALLLNGLLRVSIRYHVKSEHRMRHLSPAPQADFVPNLYSAGATFFVFGEYCIEVSFFGLVTA